MELVNSAFSHGTLYKSITLILESNTLMAMGSTQNGKSYINTSFFAYDNFFNLYFLSSPSTNHIKNIQFDPFVSVAIWNTPPKFGEGLQGIQLFGKCISLDNEELTHGLNTFNFRFPSFAQIISTAEDFEKGRTSSKLFVIKPNKIKIINESMLGKRNFIDIKVIQH